MTYTPSMKQLREEWISLMITDDGYSDAIPEEMAEEQWDRALAAHDAEVAAEAWDKGWRRGFADCDGEYEKADNPYLSPDLAKGSAS